MGPGFERVVMPCEGCQSQQERHRDEFDRGQKDRDPRVDKRLGLERNPRRAQESYDVARDAYRKRRKTDQKQRQPQGKGYPRLQGRIAHGLAVPHSLAPTTRVATVLEVSLASLAHSA